MDFRKPARHFSSIYSASHGYRHAIKHDFSAAFGWVLFACFCACWFYTLGMRTLIPTDEGRYAEIAREMAVSGDFITPRLNGIKYYGKPPLQAWMTALSFKAFGFGEWQARLWTGLCGMFGIFMVAYAGEKLFGRWAGLAAGLVLASTLAWGLAGHVGSYDMGLAAMMTMALCAFLLAQQRAVPPVVQRNWMAGCWAGMGLAVLTKGMVGIVLPGAALLLYMLIARDWGRWKQLHFRVGIPVFLAIVLPWFAAASIRSPEFPAFFFFREHLQRFTTDVHDRSASWYYFIPILAVGLLPWLGQFPRSLLQAWRERAEARTEFRPRLLLLIWAVFIFVFFSVSHAKLPSYILPVFPALALLIGSDLQHAQRKVILWSAGMFGACCVVMLALLPKMLASAESMEEANLYPLYAPWIATAALAGLGGSILAGWLMRHSRQYAVISLAAAGFVFGQLILVGHEPLGYYKAGVAHVPAMRAELDAQTPLYSVGAYEYAIPFYLQRTFTLVDYAADGMELGLKMEPQHRIGLGEFSERWRTDAGVGKRALAILTPGIHAQLEAQHLPMRIVAQDGRRIIVASDRAKQ